MSTRNPFYNEPKWTEDALIKAMEDSLAFIAEDLAYYKKHYKTFATIGNVSFGVHDLMHQLAELEQRAEQRKAQQTINPKTE